MGVSLPGGGGKGGRKGLNVNVNLVPFIDLLSALISFLIMTAVWNQTNLIEVEQGVNPNPPESDKPPDPDDKPPIGIEIQKDGILIGRTLPERIQIPLVAKGATSAATGNPALDEKFCTEALQGQCYDYPKLEELIVEKRKEKPDEEMIIIMTDDGVWYQEMIRTMDLTRKLGYPKTLLSGTPE